MLLSAGSNLTSQFTDKERDAERGLDYFGARYYSGAQLRLASPIGERASETFQILLKRTSAREALATRGFQSLANLSKIERTLRALQGDATFSRVVDLLSTIDEEGLAESESVEEFFRKNMPPRHTNMWRPSALSR
jgi:hypothetical protein